MKTGKRAFRTSVFTQRVVGRWSRLCRGSPLGLTFSVFPHSLANRVVTGIVVVGAPGVLCLDHILQKAIFCLQHPVQLKHQPRMDGRPLTLLDTVPSGLYLNRFCTPYSSPCSSRLRALSTPWCIRRSNVPSFNWRARCSFCTAPLSETLSTPRKAHFAARRCFPRSFPEQSFGTPRWDISSFACSSRHVHFTLLSNPERAVHGLQIVRWI